MIRSRTLLAGLVGAALLVTGCGYAETEVPQAAADDATIDTGVLQSDCDTDTIVNSYAPDDDRSAARGELLNSGRLVVGVSADSQLLGARNPRTGDIEGFDIDLAERIAAALGVPLELRVITAADRLRLLTEREVDLVIRNMTITCDRWEEIAFSAEYYRSGQKVLVREDLAERYSGPADLADRRVCAPGGTTSLARIAVESPEAELVPASSHTGCLLSFQQGRVDAITGDDTVLAGLAAQDPYAVVPEQEPFSDEPYGVGVHPDNVALVRFVNHVIAERGSAWQESYDRWLGPELGPASQPEPKYGLG
jgi:polar amino acid transport system substrate-binding protein